MSDGHVVDLSRLSTRAWIPRVDDFGRPSEARLYAELVRSAGLRLSVGVDGIPRVSVSDGFNENGGRVLKVPSPELTAYLDSFRIRRGQTLLDEEVAFRFVRLVRARCASPDFVPDAPQVPEAVSSVVPRPPPGSEYEEVRDLAVRLADPSTVRAFIRHRTRLSSEVGLRILTVPVGVRGRVFVLERSDGSGAPADPSPATEVLGRGIAGSPAAPDRARTREGRRRKGSPSRRPAPRR
ncbi:MAG: hypothetical protein ACLQD8_02025 [Thermoplasmata archaeon]